jgi:hypothetical protein
VSSFVPSDCKFTVLVALPFVIVNFPNKVEPSDMTTNPSGTVKPFDETTWILTVTPPAVCAEFAGTWRYVVLGA